ncbi:hypothetical protein [Paenibacillus oryzisoli]|uniref:Uncharacterized protein n=1 Tax=Paenibacillus oryzisoli TaxID=1850517 RepID=A0A198A2K3_9BACL|nr:hypothetical protein [Paenibacillus oryzisoli]OAS15405.1 hypothetical protein A8708_04435 [Paenibacillus oryzisoli]
MIIKQMRLVSIVLLISMLFTLSANAATSPENNYKEEQVYEDQSGINMATLFPDAKDELKADWEKMYEGYKIVKVSETKMFYRKDENNKLVPITVKEFEQQSKTSGVGTNGVGSNTNYGITVYHTTASCSGACSYPTEWLLGGSFQWNVTPSLDTGNSVDAFVIGWAGGLAIKQGSTSGVVHYDEGDTNPAVVTVNPNAGVGWEFSEAIDKTFPANNWYASSGSFSVTIIKSTSNSGNIANSIGQYNQSYDTKTLTSLGLSLSSSGGGFSIGWATTTKVSTIPAYTTFTY